MVEAFEIDSQAKMIPAEGNIHRTETHKVLVYIDHDTKTIYLWRGKKAGVMKKLVGTRVAARLSHKYNDYRIRPISEDNEPAAFLDLINEPIP